MWTRAIAGATPHDAPISPQASARSRRIASARAAGSELRGSFRAGVAAGLTCPWTVARFRIRGPGSDERRRQEIQNQGIERTPVVAAARFGRNVRTRRTNRTSAPPAGPITGRRRRSARLRRPGARPARGYDRAHDRAPQPARSGESRKPGEPGRDGGARRRPPVPAGAGQRERGAAATRLRSRGIEPAASCRSASGSTACSTLARPSSS